MTTTYRPQNYDRWSDRVAREFFEDMPDEGSLVPRAARREHQAIVLMADLGRGLKHFGEIMEFRNPAVVATKLAELIEQMKWLDEKIDDLKHRLDSI
jgi:hypothetical protein